MYLLSGIVTCECGRRLHGQTRSSRGREWRYYLCRRCGTSLRAEDIDSTVLGALRSLVLPAATIERARDELRRRLALPARDASRTARMRLERRIDRLGEQYEWGHIERAAYLAKVSQARAELAMLPDPQTIVTFD